MKNSKRFLLLSATCSLALLGALVMGCGPASTTNSTTSATTPTTTGPAASGKTPLTIAYSDWPGWLVWEIALQKGFFKDAGADVDFKWMEYGPSIDAYSAGKVDAVNIVCGDSLTAGKPSVAVVLTDYSDGNDMIVGKPGVGSIKDLKGKTVGLELTLVEHILLDKALEDNGMTEADLTIKPFPTNDTPQTLASGGVDAIGAWYPVSGQALTQVAGSKPLYTSSNAPGLIYDALQVSKESLDKRRDDWKKVVGVWFKSLEYLNDPKTHDDAVKIMAAKVGAKPEDFEKNLKGTHLLDKEGNLKALQKGDTLASVYGSIKHANEFYLKHMVYKDSLDADGYVDPSVVKDVVGKK